MSIMTVPKAVYDQLLHDSIARRIKAGLSKQVAVHSASEMMQSSFCYSDSPEALQKDFDEDQTGETR